MKKKISLILITAMIATGTMFSFADVKFSDVSDQDWAWAKGYITKMAEKKIISGELDNNTFKIKFRPGDNVTYIESIQMMYNMLKATDKVKNTDGLTSKYRSALIQNNIPTWAYEAVSYALEEDIIMSGDLQSFVKYNKQVPAKKQDVSIFLGKALNKKIDPLPTQIYKFVDAEVIKSAAVPYVDLLAKEGIVKGDKGKFNPNSNVTRAVMAVMCSNTYDVLIKEEPKENVSKDDVEGTIDYINIAAKTIVVKNAIGDKKPYTLKTTYIKKDDQYIQLSGLREGDSVKLNFNSSGEVQIIEVTASSSTEIVPDDKTGSIDYIDEDTDMIIVKNGKGDTAVYNLKGVRIKINGSSKRIDDLNKGDGIKLVFDKEGELDEIQIDNKVTKMTGRVVSLKEIDKHDDVYLLTVRDKSNLILKKEFRIDNSTEIEYDNDDVKATKIMEDMEVYIKYVGDRAIKIEIEEEEKSYHGILESRVLFRTTPILKVKMNDGEIKDFEIDEKDVDVERNGDDVYLDELEKGDIVTIEVEYGKVTEIEAITREDRKTRVEGKIKQITIGDPSKITIETDDDKELVTYDITRGVDVRIDNHSADNGHDYKLKDLDVGYEVEIRIDNGKVYRIDADEASTKDTIIGIVTRTYDSSRLRIRYLDSLEKEYKNITVFTEDDATIVGTDGKNTTVRSLDEDDEVFVDGQFEDDMFKASRIVQLK